MAEKSADIHTLAPRLSYVEDLTEWLKDNRGSGGGGIDQKHWRASLEGAEASGSWSSTPWTATNLIYGPDSAEKMSLHQTIFGLNYQAAIKCQDGKGLYGQVFPANETRWQYGPSQGGNVTLATEIFGNTANGYVESLRAASQTLVKAIWGDPMFIGNSDTIIGRIQQVAEELEELASNMESEVTRIENSFNSQLTSIRSRLSAGGL